MPVMVVEPQFLPLVETETLQVAPIGKPLELFPSLPVEGAMGRPTMQINFTRKHASPAQLLAWRRVWDALLQS